MLMGNVEYIWYVCAFAVILTITVQADDILGCGGFVKSEVDINFSLIEVKLYTKQGSLKYQTDCAPNNGYYMIPVYDKGDYILKVEPPPGWTFEPSSVDLHIDGSTDKCSRNEDVNFRFTGFGVIGKVVSQGASIGPAGVSLTLVNSQGQTVQQTTSIDGGSFTFEKVLPGSYMVKASHVTWQFEKSSVDVTVGRQTGDAGSKLTVIGYDVKGTIMNEGIAVKDVKFLLFSASGKSIKHCDSTEASNFPQIPDMKFICFVSSDEAGQFLFPVVPHGDYQLVPFYKGAHITFDVVPSQVVFTVLHDSVFIKEVFQVTGFSVTGRVFTNTKGVSGAVVYIDGRQVALTASDGSYHLDSMKAGRYEMRITAPQLQFNPTPVQITPNTPYLPDVFAARFQVCGQIIIDKIPSSLVGTAIEKRVSVQVKGDDSTRTTLMASENGDFCTYLKPDTYVFKVLLDAVQLNAGLSLAPAHKEVHVSDEPISGLVFSQFRAHVTGTISCLGDCGSQQMSLTAAEDKEERQITQAVSSEKKATYEFSDVMPGTYRVSIHDEIFCWKTTSQQIELVDKHMTGVDFLQTGYILAVSSSHQLRLKFAKEGGSDTGHFDVTRGVNRFCLSQPGVYSLTPESCHQFQQAVYMYDISAPSLVTLTAVRHLVQGVITSPERQDDIKVTLRSSLDEANPIVIGPLKCEQGSKVNKVADKGSFTYKFTHWALPSEVFDVSASSGVLLFYPSSVRVTLNTDICPSALVTLSARMGVFIEGDIQPAIAGVQITITPLTQATSTIKVETDSHGHYRVGPLDGDTKYSVSGEKEGYVLTAIADIHGSFKAFKLAEIAVQVRDESKAALAGVLLSLSGGDNYRSNSLSGADGWKSFMSLSPGQYFLRPMMKEYRFEPASLMIDVEEGSTINFNITANRVAFSCYGVVTSLNGEPEPGVFVEATAYTENTQCEVLQEEAQTESDGTFRIRGLQPRCEYDVHLRIGDNVNQHIERATPKSRIVKVSEADIRDVKMIAFRRSNQMDLSGNVITSQDFMSTLVVRLYNEKNIDVAVHTISLGVSSFFYFPSILSDGQTYVMRLDSTLSKASYKFDISEVTFTANKSYQHFTFHFSAKHKTLEQELSGTSYMILPLTAIVILLIYTQSTWLPLVLQSVDILQSRVNEQLQGTTQQRRNSEEDSSVRPVIDTSGVRRKQKMRKT